MIGNRLFLYLLMAMAVGACQVSDSPNVDRSGTFFKLLGNVATDESYNNTGFALARASDGGFVCLGTTVSQGTSQSAILMVKVDKDGNRKWVKTLPGNEGRSILATNDGGFVVVGDLNTRGQANLAGFANPVDSSNVLLFRTDGEGNVVWSRTLGSAVTIEKGYFVTSTTDGGFLLIGNRFVRVGQTQQSAVVSVNMQIVRTNGLGVPSLAREYGLTGTDNQIGTAIQTTDPATNEQLYLWCGTASRQGATTTDARMVLANEFGNLRWDFFYGGAANDVGSDVKQAGNGFILVGSTQSGTGGGFDVFLVRTDSDGRMLWSQTFGGPNDDFGASVAPTRDGGFIIVGSTASSGNGGSDMYVIKTDGLGNQQWVKTFGGTGNDTGRSVVQTDDGRYLILGTMGFDNNTMMGLIKLNENGELVK